MNAIVSVTRDWGIGLDGDLAVNNRADMRRFVTLTCSGKRPKDAAPGELLGTVIMGRKTFESLPNGPLKARRNIVVTRNPDYAPAGVEVVHSPAEALELVRDTDPETVWLIGGESLYRQMLDHCKAVHVTMNDVDAPADAYFPNLDTYADWELSREEEGGVTEAGVPFSYRTYTRSNK